MVIIIFFPACARICTLSKKRHPTLIKTNQNQTHTTTTGDDGGDVSSWAPAKQEQFQEIRCASAARGSMYDQRVGITCHFCRQKKLCGEPDCPRCSRRNANADCIGKTECSKCAGPNGRFCRACLLLR